MPGPGRTRGTLVALVVVLLVGAAGGLAAVLLSGSGSSARPPAGAGPTSGAPSPSCPRDAAGLKPALAGVVAIDDLPAGSDASFLGGVSVNVAWADLQPGQGAALVHPNAIDREVAALRARGPGCRLGIKLRVLAGVHAPAWVLALSGGPVQLSSAGPQPLAGSIPRFWTDSVGTAYDDLQRRLAAAYDDVPEVREVVMSRCTTFYAEPLLRQIDPTGGNGAAYVAAGLDATRDEACLTQQTAAHEVWRHTRSSLALNPYIAPGASPPRAGLDLPLRVARDCRAVLGARCILANNSIRWPVLTGLYPALYDAMTRLGAPLEFQTAAPNRIGNAAATVSWAAGEQAGSVEMEPGLITSTSAALTALAADGRLPGAAALAQEH